MKTITIALQKEMKARIIDNQIIIEVPDNCSRDLWDAQLEVWLESNNKMTSSKFIRVNNDKLIISK